MNQMAEAGIDFLFYVWKTLGPSLLIMVGVLVAYTAGKDKWPWGIVLSCIIIGISSGWIFHAAEVRGKEKLLTALVEAGRDKAGGGE